MYKAGVCTVMMGRCSRGIEFLCINITNHEYGSSEIS